MTVPGKVWKEKVTKNTGNQHQGGTSFFSFTVTVHMELFCCEYTYLCNWSSFGTRREWERCLSINYYYFCWNCTYILSWNQNLMPRKQRLVCGKKTSGKWKIQLSTECINAALFGWRYVNCHKIGLSIVSSCTHKLSHLPTFVAKIKVQHFFYFGCSCCSSSPPKKKRRESQVRK